jgi:hypothetical protein
LESIETGGSSDESGSEDEDYEKISYDERGPIVIGENCGCECDHLVLSTKPHWCNDAFHVGNRNVFGAFCLPINNRGGESFSHQCKACARRAAEVVNIFA